MKALRFLSAISFATLLFMGCTNGPSGTTIPEASKSGASQDTPGVSVSKVAASQDGTTITFADIKRDELFGSSDFKRGSR